MDLVGGVGGQSRARLAVPGSWLQLVLGVGVVPVPEAAVDSSVVMISLGVADARCGWWSRIACWAAVSWYT